MMWKRRLLSVAWLALAVILVGGAAYRTSVTLGPEEAGSDVPAGQGQSIGQVHGTVRFVDSEMLVMETADGEQVIIEGQPWTYALAQGFTCQPGESVTVTGYPEEDEFKAMQITAASGVGITLRDADGRPAWAGQGRGRGG